MDSINQTVKELTLMLIYLTSWKEKGFNEQYRRAWKGYDFGILNQLTDDESIFDSSKSKSKSIHIGETGIECAKQLLQKYGIEETE